MAPFRRSIKQISASLSKWWAGVARAQQWPRETIRLGVNGRLLLNKRDFKRWAQVTGLSGMSYARYAAQMKKSYGHAIPEVNSPAAQKEIELAIEQRRQDREISGRILLAHQAGRAAKIAEDRAALLQKERGERQRWEQLEVLEYRGGNIPIREPGSTILLGPGGERLLARQDFENHQRVGVIPEGQAYDDYLVTMYQNYGRVIERVNTPEAQAGLQAQIQRAGLLCEAMADWRAPEQSVLPQGGSASSPSSRETSLSMTSELPCAEAGGEFPSRPPRRTHRPNGPSQRL